MVAQAHPPVFLRDATGLVREFGPLTAFVLTFNTIVGGGVYAFSVQQVHHWPGSIPWMGMLIAAIPVTAVGLVYTWIASAMPRSGGDYIYLSRILHPVLGWGVTWLILVNRVFGIALLTFIDAKLWGAGLTVLGLRVGHDGLREFGRLLGTDDGVAGVGAVLLLLSVLGFAVAGGAPFRHYLWAIFLLPLVGGMVSIVLFALHGGGFPALWDATYGAGAYQEIVRLAGEGGWTATPPSFDATVAALGVAIFAFALAPFASSTIGGEVQQPRFSFWVAIPGCTVFSAGYMALFAAAPYWAAGEFVSQYDFVYYTQALRGQLQINPGLEPTIPVFAVALAGDPVVGALVVLGGALSLYHVVPSLVLTTPRYLLAVSFDRFLPGWLADVSDRFHCPLKAMLLLIAGGILAVALRVWFGLNPVLVALSIVVPFVWGAMGLAGIVIPYRMPRVYALVRRELSGAGEHLAAFVLLMAAGSLLGIMMFGLSALPAALLTGLACYPLARGVALLASRVAQREVGRVPVIVLAGVVAAGFGGYICLNQLQRSLGTPAGREAVAYTFVTLAAGLVVFGYHYLRNRARGISLRDVYSEIPPE